LEKKISKQQLKEIVNNVREETRDDFTKRVENVIGPSRGVTFDEYARTIVPKLLSATYLSAITHAEYVIYDVLENLDLLTDDGQED
jgi:hypothetical protein